MIHNAKQSRCPVGVSVRKIALFLFACLLVTSLPRSVSADSASTPPGGILAAFEQELRGMMSSVAPSVVTIRATRSPQANDGSAPKRQSSMSVGSGMLLDSTGLIMTSSSVVDGGDDFWVESADGRMYQAILVGSSADVAVLEIKGRGLRATSFGDASLLGVGSLVVAIGNSYGYSSGVSWGVVNGFRPDGTIQLALGVSPGNSGGALVDTRGQVVGLIKARISEPFYLDPLHFPQDENRPPFTIPGRRLELPTSTVSLAIPIQTALRAAYRIIEAGTEARAYVGVYVDDLTGWYVAHFKTSEGVLVTGVVSQTPAARAGLLQGDVITAVDRLKATSVRRFRQIVSQSVPGQRLVFDLIRGGKPLRLTIEVGEAETPHMGATDPQTAPFGAQNSHASVATAQTSRAGRRSPDPGSARFESSSDAPSRESPPRDDTAAWHMRIDQMQHALDSISGELLELQAGPPR